MVATVRALYSVSNVGVSATPTHDRTTYSVYEAVPVANPTRIHGLYSVYSVHPNQVFANIRGIYSVDATVQNTPAIMAKGGKKKGSNSPKTGAMVISRMAVRRLLYPRMVFTTFSSIPSGPGQGVQMDLSQQPGANPGGATHADTSHGLRVKQGVHLK